MSFWKDFDWRDWWDRIHRREHFDYEGLASVLSFLLFFFLFLYTPVVSLSWRFFFFFLTSCSLVLFFCCYAHTFNKKEVLNYGIKRNS